MFLSSRQVPGPTATLSCYLCSSKLRVGAAAAEQVIQEAKLDVRHLRGSRFCTRLFVSALRTVVRFVYFQKHEDLPPTHVEGLFGICMQSALHAMRVRKNDVRASSVQLYEDVLDLADVGLDGVWR
jgi:hypothetical protein